MKEITKKYKSRAPMVGDRDTYMNYPVFSWVRKCNTGIMGFISGREREMRVQVCSSLRLGYRTKDQ